MSKCVVCGKGGRTGSTAGSHKICLQCMRKGYKFRAIEESTIQILDPEDKVVNTKRIYKKPYWI